jgi:hypothetical protein
MSINPYQPEVSAYITEKSRIVVDKILHYILIESPTSPVLGYIPIKSQHQLYSYYMVYLFQYGYKLQCIYGYIPTKVYSISIPMKYSHDNPITFPLKMP